MNRQLSPAAQAVLDAYFTEADRLDREVSDNEMLAAVLRAAALHCKRDAVTLLAIADELDMENE
jgi:predicted P-loop ATPase